jgi:hypothetical protein
MGDPSDHDKPPESDHEVDQAIKDAAQATNETRKLETLGREADRLLDLIQEAELAPIETSQPTPTGAAARADGPGANAQPLIQPTESPVKTETSPPKGWPLILPLLGLAVVVGFAIRGGVGNAPFNEALQQRPPSARLGYQASCGSQSNENSSFWWPVLAEYDPALLQEVRRSYCGDAFKNNRGDLQVASFTSLQIAQNFVQLLSEATGGSFRVGQRYAQATTNPPSLQENSSTPLPSRDKQKQASGLSDQHADATANGAEVAIESVTSLYNALSNKNFNESTRWHTAAVSEMFRPDFFSQFSRVSVTDLRVRHTDGRQVILSGITRFVYPDNRNQTESRNFTVDLAANPPQVVASEFVRVLKPR